MARVDADEGRLEAGRDELAREPGGFPVPQGKASPSAGRRQALLAVGPDVLEEQVPERERLDARQRLGCESLLHPLLVHLVGAPHRDLDLDQRNADGLGLTAEQRPAHPGMEMRP